MGIRFLSATGLAGLLSFLCLTSPAQDNKAVFPPDVIPSTFRAFLVTDGRFLPIKTSEGKEIVDPKNRTGKIHCLVCENGLAPVIAVFVRADVESLGADKGLADLIKRTDALIPKYRADKLASFVMFLPLEGGTKEVTIKTVKDGVETESKIEQDKEYPDEDDKKRDAYADEIRKFADAVKAPNVPFGLAANKSKALTEWKIKEKDEAEVTVIVYYRMRRVGDPWIFKKASDIKDEVITKILKSAEDAITKTKR